MSRVIVFALAVVFVASFAPSAGVLETGTAAYLNGVAAIITAVVYLAEKRNTSEAVRALETRVAVLEAKA